MKRKPNDELRQVVLLARRAPELVPSFLTMLLTSPVAERFVWDLEERPKVEELAALIELGLGRYVNFQASWRPPRPPDTRKNRRRASEKKRDPVLVGRAAAAMRFGLGVETVLARENR